MTLYHYLISQPRYDHLLDMQVQHQSGIGLRFGTGNTGMTILKWGYFCIYVAHSGQTGKQTTFKIIYNLGVSLSCWMRCMSSIFETLMFTYQKTFRPASTCPCNSCYVSVHCSRIQMPNWHIHGSYSKKPLKGEMACRAPVFEWIVSISFQ